MRPKHCSSGALLLGLLLAPAAWAQCAACSNPSFQAADDPAALLTDKLPGWTMRAGLTYAYVLAPDVQVGPDPVANVEGRQTRLQALTLQAEGTAPTGTALGLSLPWGWLESRGNGRVFDDQGAGDLDLRVRQNVSQLTGVPRGLPVVRLGVGVVAPTGSYSRSSDPGAAGRSSSQYASLGRGTWWGQAEADLLQRLPLQIAILAGVHLRQALADAPDGFRWGREVRARLGGAWEAWPEHVRLTLNLERLSRDPSSEVLGGERVDSISTGGTWWVLAPAVTALLPRGLEWTAGVRLPLAQNVRGLQNVETVHVYAALAWSAADE